MTSPESNGNSALRVLPILVILIVAVAGTVLLRDQISFEALRDNRDALLAFRDAHYVASVLVYMSVYVAVVTFSLPGAAMGTITGGFLFGLFPGLLFASTAATTGALVVFLAARMGFGDRLAARMDESDGKIGKVKDAIRENEIPVLLLLRLVPVMPFFLANLVIASLGVGLVRFVVTTYLGILPGGFVFASLGRGLGEIIDAGERPDPGIIFEPHILWPLLGLAALTALPVVIRLVWKRDV